MCKSVLAKWILAAGIVFMCSAETVRNPEVPHQFQRLHPCPSTGKTHGACPGYVRDHIIPLCKDGPDTVDNMQWQTIVEGKAKDRWECK